MPNGPKATISAALSSMCYREVRPRVWAKPVGCHLFVFDLALVWTNWFRAKDGSLDIWERETLPPDREPLSWIKEKEAFTRINVAWGSGSQFELASPTLLELI